MYGHWTDPSWPSWSYAANDSIMDRRRSVITNVCRITGHHAAPLRHHAAPHGTTRHHSAPRGTTRHHTAPRGTTRHHAAPLGTTQTLLGTMRHHSARMRYHAACTTRHQAAPSGTKRHRSEPYMFAYAMRCGLKMIWIWIQPLHLN